MEIDFDEMKKINDAVKNASNKWEIKSFKPWESEGGKEMLTIQLIKKDEKELKYLNVENVVEGE